MMPNTDPLVQVCFGPNRTESTGMKPGLFDGPSLPKSTDPPTLYTLPTTDILIQVHERLRQAAYDFQLAHCVCQHVMANSGHSDVEYVRQGLHQLAEADKILCERMQIPHDPTYFALNPVSPQLAGPTGEVWPIGHICPSGPPAPSHCPICDTSLSPGGNCPRCLNLIV